MNDQCGWYSAPSAIQLLERLLLRGGELLVRLRRRHDLVRIVGQ